MDKPVVAAIITVMLLMFFFDKNTEIMAIFNMSPATQLSVSDNGPKQPAQVTPPPKLVISEPEQNQEKHLESNGLAWGVKNFNYDTATKMLSYTLFTNQNGFIKFGEQHIVEMVEYKDMPFNSVVNGQGNLLDYNITFENNAQMNMFLDLGKYIKEGHYRMIRNFRDNEYLYHWIITFDIDEFGVARDIKEQIYLGEKLF